LNMGAKLLNNVTWLEGDPTKKLKYVKRTDIRQKMYDLRPDGSPDAYWI